MAYADVQYYRENYGGSIIPDEQLGLQLERASDQVDSLTYNRIRAIGFDNLTPFQQEQVKKAVCIQAEFITQYGEYISFPLQSFSVGDISLSFAGEKINGVTTSKDVLAYLGQTGLTSRRL